MISNVRAGIANTPENLGLAQPNQVPAASEPVSPEAVPAAAGSVAAPAEKVPTQ